MALFPCLSRLGLDVGRRALWAQFRGHDRLASYCGPVPAARQSGKSINYDKPSRGGNKALKNLLVFSCNSLMRSKSRYGEYLRARISRGTKYKCALEATARERVIYAVLRGGTPYSA